VFLQTLLQTVAYGTLARRVRKSRHVSAARHLEQTWPGEAYDIAEVLASHYLAAINADPDAEDVPALFEDDEEWRVPADATAADALAGYWEEIAVIDRILEGASMDDPNQGGDEPGEHKLRRTIVHMIEEYARHCGHADLLREAIDGTIGD
jgi:hypothetical protein